MGNLADSKRLREAKGLYKYNPGDGIITKEELNYIPFLGNNPTDNKPAIYNGVFNLPSTEEAGKKGKIELEAKRSGGRIRLTCEANDEHNRAIFECVERFVAAIFDGTAREIREAQPDDSEMMKLKKHIDQLEKENMGHIETLERLQDIMK